MFLSVLLTVDCFDFVSAIVHVMAARGFLGFETNCVRGGCSQTFNKQRVAKFGGIWEVKLHHFRFLLPFHPQ